MNSRERVRIAMCRGTPDRVPFLPQICHPHAIRVLGHPYESTCLDVIRHPERMNRLTLDACRFYGVDGLRAWIPPPPADVVNVDGVWYGLDPASGQRLGPVDFLGGGGIVSPETPSLRTEEDIDAIPVPSAEEILRSGRLDSVRSIVQNGGKEFFIISCPGHFTVEYLAAERGKEQAMVDLYERPGFCHRALEKAYAVALQHAFALQSVGVDAFLLGDTFGGVVGPDWFREFCLPYWTRFVRDIHEAFGPQRPLIYIHICGRSAPLFELMADTGADAIEPLDPLGGVQVRDAKARVGDRVAIMGGVNTLELAHGSLADVRADVRRCLSEGAPGGGYLLACGDMLPTETSPEKVDLLAAMAKAWKY